MTIKLNVDAKQAEQELNKLNKQIHSLTKKRLQELADEQVREAYYSYWPEQHLRYIRTRERI